MSRLAQSPVEPGNATPLRILHTATTFSLASGAAENIRLTLKHLPRDTFQLFIACPPGQSMDARVPPDVVHLPVPHLARAIHPWRDLRAFLEIYRLLKRSRFHVVHTHNAKDGILGRWAAFLAGVPVIVHTIHNVSFRASQNRFANLLYAMAERLTSCITQGLVAVSSQNVADYLYEGIGKKEQYQVIYSGLELDKYAQSVDPAEVRSSLGIGDASTVVGWFGRLNYQKDPLTFIQAARIITDHLPGVHFLVCGDDPLDEGLEAEVKELVNALAMTERVHFLGFQNDLPRYLNAIDILMHSSRYEGMGRVPSEALLCGRAIAGTAVDGMRELVASGTRGGILVPPGDPNRLAEAALELLRNPARAKALAAAGKRWVEDNLSAAQMASHLTTLYERLLSSRHPDRYGATPDVQ